MANWPTTFDPYSAIREAERMAMRDLQRFSYGQPCASGLTSALNAPPQKAEPKSPEFATNKKLLLLKD